MNNDLIRRGDVKAKKVYCVERYEYVVPVAEIDLLPAVNEARNKGKWLIDDFDMKTYTEFTREATDRDTTDMYCSECHGHAGLNGAEDYVPSKYCPNCGVEMEVKIWQPTI